MGQYVRTWLRIRTNQRAVTTLDYGLIAGLIVAVVTLGFDGLMIDGSSSFKP